MLRGRNGDKKCLAQAKAGAGQCWGRARQEHGKAEVMQGRDRGRDRTRATVAGQGQGRAATGQSRARQGTVGAGHGRIKIGQGQDRAGAFAEDRGRAGQTHLRRTETG